METTRQTRTVDEAAAVLGISRTLAYQLVARGDLPSITIGRRKLIPLSKLAELLSVPTTDVP
jgi:excisionase family DNA binding protein